MNLEYEDLNFRRQFSPLGFAVTVVVFVVERLIVCDTAHNLIPVRGVLFTKEREVQPRGLAYLRIKWDLLRCFGSL